MISVPSANTPRLRIWLHHAWLPLLLFVTVAWLFATTGLDLAIARAVFFDAAQAGWVGGNSWFVNEVIHTGGRWAVRIVALLVLVLWVSSFRVQALRHRQRALGYLLSAIVMTIGTVGLLKTVTNVDCPWDLSDFGGHFPYVDLFSSRPTELRRGRCFPAAHASSGYAFMALYFLAHERSRTLARTGLAIGLLLGAVFGLAQQSRGAHFVSHDLWSAFFGWMIPLTLYAFAFGGRLYPRSQHSALYGSRAPNPSSCPRTGLVRKRHPRDPSLGCPSEMCSTTCVRKA